MRAPHKLIPDIGLLEKDALTAQASLEKLGELSGHELPSSPTMTTGLAGASLVGQFQACFSYGYIGELRNAPHPDTLRKLIAITVFFRVYSSLFPAIATDFPEEGGQLEKILFLTYARNKIDAANGVTSQSYAELAPFFDDSNASHLNFYELSLLANMSDMAVRNATRSQGKDHLKATKRKGRAMIAAPVAADWLADRNGYRPTKPYTENQSIDHNIKDDEIVIVPFAADGTFFPQNCARAGHYRIGPKGDEHPYDDKYDALAKLRKMHKARWRRPNSNGIPGIVTAREWKPISQEEFERH